MKSLVHSPPLYHCAKWLICYDSDGISCTIEQLLVKKHIKKHRSNAQYPQQFSPLLQTDRQTDR